MRYAVALGGTLCVCLGAGSARADDVSTTAPRAAARDRFQALKQGDSAAETYELNALGLVHMKSGWSLFSPSEWWRPVRGKYRDAMTYVDFFAAVGRPDLAASQATRNTWSDVLFYGGLLVLAGGVVVAVHGGTSQAAAETYAGLGLAGGGLACSIVGGAISGPVVSEDEASTLTDRYNRELGTRLLQGGKSALAAPGGPWSTPWTIGLRAAF